MMAKSAAKNLRYALADGFFLIWFRFVERYGHLVEMRMFDELRRVVARDYETFSGGALERWFREKLLEDSGLTRLGGWWNRKGGNEINIVAANELDRLVDFIEVKRVVSRISLPRFRERVIAFFESVPQWKDLKAGIKGVSLGDMLAEMWISGKRFPIIGKRA